eukprot:1049562-Amorphochlora_amoeboformis.AAC.1
MKEVLGMAHDRHTINKRHQDEFNRDKKRIDEERAQLLRDKEDIQNLLVSTALKLDELQTVINVKKSQMEALKKVKTYPHRSQTAR